MSSYPRDNRPVPSPGIHEIWPLTCTSCDGPVRIVAFITERAPIRQILLHLGEPHEPPPLHPSREPPQAGCEDQTICLDDDLNQDLYPFDPDQRVSW